MAALRKWQRGKSLGIYQGFCYSPNPFLMDPLPWELKPMAHTHNSPLGLIWREIRHTSRSVLKLGSSTFNPAHVKRNECGTCARGPTCTHAVWMVRLTDEIRINTTTDVHVCKRMKTPSCWGCSCKSPEPHLPVSALKNYLSTVFFSKTV